jgi:predicted amidohydrolase
MDASEAIRNLADYTDEIVTRMRDLALSYNVNIIAGSMPEYDGKKLRNVSYLCRRDGTVDKQYKLHITPDEQSYWGLQGGNGIKVFDTDAGKIGILICYDVEFPELGRILAEQEMDILFVPYWTDTKNAFLRVNTCAKARAVENECYVAITGSVGNLPRVENMDIQYSQAAIYSPSDFSFPHDATVAQASENAETTIVADVDLDLLTKQRKAGSVRNLDQRRLDLYSIHWKKKK